MWLCRCAYKPSIFTLPVSVPLSLMSMPLNGGTVFNTQHWPFLHSFTDSLSLWQRLSCLLSVMNPCLRRLRGLMSNA
ncbi:hypothetical protein [Shewanella oncorhynchi]|uniref:hypothetical protein n=1 Tax=Shewanella oncorhynchi TaxID=2726434 RepID=UPI003D7A5F81